MMRLICTLAFLAVLSLIPTAPVLAADCANGTSTSGTALQRSLIDPCLLHNAPPAQRVPFEHPMACVPYQTVVPTGVGYYALRHFDPTIPLELQLGTDNVAFSGWQRATDDQYVCRNVQHFRNGNVTAVVFCDELGFSGAVQGETLQKAIREGWLSTKEAPYGKGWTPKVPLGTPDGWARWRAQRGAAVWPPPLTFL
jgi:hypothetical protein